jgi:hypothetical protein
MRPLVVMVVIPEEEVEAFSDDDKASGLSYLRRPTRPRRPAWRICSDVLRSNGCHPAWNVTAAAANAEARPFDRRRGFGSPRGLSPYLAEKVTHTSRTTKRAGAKRAGAKRAGAKRAGAKRAGAKRAGAKRAGAKRAGAKRAGAKRMSPGVRIRGAVAGTLDTSMNVRTSTGQMGSIKKWRRGNWRAFRRFGGLTLREVLAPQESSNRTRRCIRWQGSRGVRLGESRFAWEADTLPAELLPLGRNPIVAERRTDAKLRRDAGPRRGSDALRARQNNKDRWHRRVGVGVMAAALAHEVDFKPGTLSSPGRARYPAGPSRRARPPLGSREESGDAP